MAKLGLTINEAKTSLKDARVEDFDFLVPRFNGTEDRVFSVWRGRRRW
jgi:hypothetical protein